MSALPSSNAAPRKPQWHAGERRRNASDCSGRTTQYEPGRTQLEPRTSERACNMSGSIEFRPRSQVSGRHLPTRIVGSFALALSIWMCLAITGCGACNEHESLINEQADPPTPINGAMICTHEDLLARRNVGSAMSIWTGIWYAGSDDQYHYFWNNTKLSKERLAVPVQHLAVEGSFRVSNNEKDWREISKLLLPGVRALAVPN